MQEFRKGWGGGGAPINKKLNEVENGRVHRKWVGTGGGLCGSFW